MIFVVIVNVRQGLLSVNGLDSALRIFMRGNRFIFPASACPSDFINAGLLSTKSQQGIENLAKEISLITISG
jgi:hypothetical protein